MKSYWVLFVDLVRICASWAIYLLLLGHKLFVGTAIFTRLLLFSKILSAMRLKTYSLAWRTEATHTVVIVFLELNAIRLKLGIIRSILGWSLKFLLRLKVGLIYNYLVGW